MGEEEITLIRLDLRALPKRTSDGKPWPVPIRLRWVLKKLLREFGFRAEKVSFPRKECTDALAAASRIGR